MGCQSRYTVMKNKMCVQNVFYRLYKRITDNISMVTYKKNI